MLASAGTRVSRVVRSRVVRCNAIAAPERPATKAPIHSPIIMNGQVLHSITQERLDLVKTLGPYLETQVMPRNCLAVPHPALQNSNAVQHAEHHTAATFYVMNCRCCRCCALEPRCGSPPTSCQSAVTQTLRIR
jgi:hypothetical protein